MSYSDVFELISLYCNSCFSILPLFADRWERFPQGENAQRVIEAIESAAQFWNHNRHELAEQLRRAIETIGANDWTQTPAPV